MTDKADNIHVLRKPGEVTNPNAVDWEFIKMQFGRGRSYRDLAGLPEACGISYQAIRRRALKEGWTRSLGQEIARETRVRLAEIQGTSAELLERLRSEDDDTRRNALKEFEVEAHVAVFKRQQDRINRLHNEIVFLQDQIEIWRRSGRMPPVLASYKAQSIADTLKVVASMIVSLQEIERRAFKLDSVKEDEGEWIPKVDRRGTPGYGEGEADGDE